MSDLELARKLDYALRRHHSTRDMLFTIQRHVINTAYNNWKIRFIEAAGLKDKRDLRLAIYDEVKAPGKNRKMAGFRYDQYDETFQKFKKVIDAISELMVFLDSGPYPKEAP